ncbi:MAG: PIN domain-containing protein [Candidatus Shapirobacteria bacterium]
MKYFIDTNIFLRVLIKENEAVFNDCLRFLQKVKAGKIKAITASLVLAEIAWALSSYYEFAPRKVALSVRGILNLKGLNIMDKYDHLLALQLFESKKVKYIDALLASIKEIQTGKWTIVSYDKDFDKLKIKRLEPKKIISA